MEHRKEFMDEEIKDKVLDYWTIRAEEFLLLKIEELNSYMRERWYRELDLLLPRKKGLKILDIGTGTGFLCFILAQEGHQMTGVDMTPKMIQEGKNLAHHLNLPVEFYVMDAENLQFSDESFDVIVTRNVTWTLPNLNQAYKEWYRVLKKSGMLINFDGDYCREEKEEKLMKEHAHKTITQEQWSCYEQMKEELRHLSFPRPSWDLTLLKEIGFQKVEVDTEVWGRIYQEMDRFYNPTPIFVISGEK